MITWRHCVRCSTEKIGSGWTICLTTRSTASSVASRGDRKIAVFALPVRLPFLLAAVKSGISKYSLMGTVNAVPATKAKLLGDCEAKAIGLDSCNYSFDTGLRKSCRPGIPFTFTLRRWPCRLCGLHNKQPLRVDFGLLRLWFIRP